MQKHIFKKYDIRGVVGQDLLVQEAYSLGKAIVSFYLSKNSEIKRIAVAYDHRIHSVLLYEQIVKAIIDSGLQVYFLGVCATPVFVFGLHRLPVQAGIMITGSHHPKEYNGFKLYIDKKSVWGADIEEIYDRYQQQSFVQSALSGRIIPCPIVDQYIDALWAEFSHLSQYDFSLIIDCAGGMAGPLLQKIIQKMKWTKVRLLLDRLDSEFKEHDPDPSQIKNMKLLKDHLQVTTSVFGIGFDGDAGRMICMEQNGRLILGDRLLALFAQDILINYPGAKIVYDVKSSMCVKQIVEKAQGVPIVSACGAPLVRLEMEKTGSIFGGEVTGHYIFKDRHQGYHDGIYAMFRLLDILVRKRQSIYELLDGLPEWHSSYEIRIPCIEGTRNEILKKVTDSIKNSKQWKVLQVDGIKIENEQGWGLLRACHTEPMLSFRCEAKTKEDLDKVKKEFELLLHDHIKVDVLKEYF